ncbi:uncharacterized protein LOC107766874 [Nicotiana tabacum]|uniref:Uncharacterized protein LOC107766874 n=1 Tax=Nicotiana tabacum TaxID=4097 RepID=A0A1S3XNL4_TOBAC|nr:PREDICTED: uncharacterized protein LOC107766874 [Nicotiana tabacum]
MRTNPRKRSQEFWCKFHNDHGHIIADSRLLQGEVEYLLKKGYLTDLFIEKGKSFFMKNRQEPPKLPSPKRTVNLITGAEEVNGVMYTAGKRTIKISVTHRKRVRQVLEGNNITFDEEDADGLIIPHNDALVISLLIYDTNVKRVLIDPGKTMLATFAEGTVKDTKFQVVDIHMAYNIILGRPLIHDMDAVPSTLHQIIKFSSQ